MCDIVGCESVGLPEDLELLPTGADLTVTLAAVDRRRLCGGDRLRLAQARNRLASSVQAELLADLYAVSLAEPAAPGRVRVPADTASRYPWAECEVAYALRWTTVAAGGRLELARQLREDLPAVWSALAAGEVDLPKTLVITDAVSVLDDVAAAREVAARVLERAAEWTTGQLRARLRSLVLAVDPEAAARRCVRAVRGRRVEVGSSPDGSGEVTGRGLAPQGVAAAWERLTAIARAAKSAGDARSMDQLRADALVDLLVGEGVAAGGPLGDHAVAEPVVTEPVVNEPVVTEPAVAEPSVTEPSVTEPSVTEPSVTEPSVTEPAVDRRPAEERGHVGERGPAAQWDPAWPAEPWEPIGPHDVTPDPTGEPRGWSDRGGAAFDGPDWPTDWPGRWHGDPAVAAAAGTEVGGAPTAPGVVPPPPPPPPPPTPTPTPAPRRGVVELQVSLETLLRLSDRPGQLAGYGPVVADIARQVAAGAATAAWRYSIYDRLGELIYHGTTTARPDRPHPAPRHPTSAVARFVRTRDGTCVAPGCRRPARTADIDHTVAHADGGPTEIANLGVLCRRHHRFKHTPGTELVQFSSGMFGWRTPLGMSYLTRPARPLGDD